MARFNKLETFGQMVYKARIMKQYSQRELSELVGVNYTYLSKLENDKADYPPSQKVIIELARYLGLDSFRLSQLAGKVSSEDMEVFRYLIKSYQRMPALLRRMKSDPLFAKRLFRLMQD